MTSVEPLLQPLHPLQPLQPQPLFQRPQLFQPLFHVDQPLFQLLQPQPLFQVVRVAVLKVVTGWLQPQLQTVGVV